MVDFDNLEELKALRARGAVDDRQYEPLRRRLARRIISDRREAAFSKSGAVYIVLAFFTGAIGLHNFYAGYTVTGLIQLVLTCTGIAVPFVIIWIIADILFTTKDGAGQPFS